MTPRTPALVAALASLTVGTAHAQTCTDPHYRWTVKTTLALQGAASTAATPSTMLHWAPLELYRPAVGVHDCTPRADRELTVYAVTGWARSWHIENGPKGDLDWHIELTQTAKTTPSKCVVVEIPDPQYGTIFATARQDFLDLIVNSNINQKKQIVPPVRLTVVGPAFFDGQHRGARGSGKLPSGHGHCNRSDSALWEDSSRVRSQAPRNATRRGRRRPERPRGAKDRDHPPAISQQVLVPQHLLPALH